MTHGTGVLIALIGRQMVNSQKEIKNQLLENYAINARVKIGAQKLAELETMIETRLLHVPFLCLLLASCVTYPVPNRQIDALNPDDALDRLVQPQSCKNLSEGQYPPLPDKLIDGARTVLYRCMMTGYLDTQFTHAEIASTSISEKPSALATNLHPAALWYRHDDGEGNQSVGLNLYNANSQRISWVIVAFAPYACREEQDWSFGLRLQLPQALDHGDKTILQWDMPEGLKISEGCLKVMAAGHP